MGLGGVYPTHKRGLGLIVERSLADPIHCVDLTSVGDDQLISGNSQRPTKARIYRLSDFSEAPKREADRKRRQLGPDFTLSALNK